MKQGLEVNCPGAGKLLLAGLTRGSHLHIRHRITSVGKG